MSIIALKKGDTFFGHIKDYAWIGKFLDEAIEGR
jgi:hypothetical protein